MTFWWILLIAIIVPSRIHSIATENTCENSNNHTLDNDAIFELILEENLEDMDSVLPNTIKMIKKRGGHKCWHKHSTFLDHLVGCHNILRLWGESQVIGRVGLLHSAYSNSYVNLALFDPREDRRLMQSLIGEEAEEFVYLFCIIDRQRVVVDTLLATGQIPENGLMVPHLRDSQVEIHLTPEVLRMLLIFTMADVADQYFGWQDRLFHGTMLLPGAGSKDDTSMHFSQALWPGESRPGVWMSYVSELCQVVKTYSRNSILPPVFHNCTYVLSRQDEQTSINLYWSAMHDSLSHEETIQTLLNSVDLNPWYFEGHVLLAQKYLHLNDNEAAERHTERALSLQKQWGCSYDKRMSFRAWVAWTRVLDQQAKQKSGWPVNSWSVNNFGMVI